MTLPVARWVLVSDRAPREALLATCNGLSSSDGSLQRVCSEPITTGMRTQIQHEESEVNASVPVPDAGAGRSLRVRVNVGGQRIVGWVDLPETRLSRCSDVLNDADPYLTVRRDVEPGHGADTTAVNKASISYVEVANDQTARRWVIPGTFQPVVIEVSTPEVVFRGELFVLADTTVVDVLNDGRRFISLRNAQLNGGHEPYEYLGVGKCRTRAVHF